MVISNLMNSLAARGRRPGKPDTRAEILRVAGPMFMDHGYDAVTLRSVADAAAVDVALISYFFGSKKGLFGAVLQLTANPAEMLEKELGGELNRLPYNVLRTALTVWDGDETGRPLIAMVRSAAQEEAVATVVREVVEREMIDKLAARLGDRDARRRAGLFSAQMVGLIYARYILRVEPVASMTVDELVRIYGPSLAATLGVLPRPHPRRFR
jgi:AcrR family transcriptional regulator